MFLPHLFDILGLLFSTLFALAVFLPILFNKHAEFWVGSKPFPKYFSNYRFVLLVWSVFVVLGSITFGLLPYPVKHDSSIELYFSVLILDLFGYLIGGLWPIFLYLYHNYRLSFVIVINTLIYKILTLIGICLYFSTFLELEDHWESFLPIFLLYPLIFLFDVYLFISHLHLIGNISSNELA